MFDAYMEIKGIPGDSEDKQHKGWIEFQSFSHGVSQSIGGARSYAGSATSGRCDHQDMTIIKAVDSASPELFKKCCAGTHIDTVTIKLMRASGESQTRVTFMQWDFKDVVISSVSPGGSAQGGDPVESVSLNYGEIKLTYVKSKGQGGGEAGKVMGGWSVTKNCLV